MTKGTDQLPERFVSTGRPKALTQEIIKAVAELLPNCMYFDSVCAALGISRQTWGNWIRRGRRELARMEREDTDLALKSEEIYLQFFVTYKRGLAQGEIADAMGIKAIGKDGAWQALAWRLERRFPEKYGSQNREVKLLQKELAELRQTVETFKSREMEVADLKSEVLRLKEELARAKGEAPSP